MKRISLCFAIALVAAFSMSNMTSAESDDVADRLKACARTADEAVRIACYEALGQETLADEQNEPATPAAGPAESTGTAAAAGVAATSVPETSTPTNVPINGEGAAEEYRIAVSSCRTNRGGDTYFVLENGETWKRTGGQFLRESECSFSATLTKDFFGYKMAIDGDKGTVRVKRVK